MAISLKHAQAVLLIEAMKDENGKIGFQDVSSMSNTRKTAFAFELLDSPDFQDRLTSAVEGAIGSYLDNYAADYGIEE